MGRHRVAFAIATLLVLALPASPVAAATEFPEGYEAYHTYSELIAELRTIRGAHPDLVTIGNIGRSYEGRRLYRVKISDNVATDEAEPEVLVTAFMHAREPISVEQALGLIHWLVDGYGSDPRTTAIVDSTEIWILPNLNPDGGEWDIRDGKFHRWRKNRQPTPGSSHVGTDLNRNFPRHWACCGASSDPASGTYRGPRPLSAPEARATRDFVVSRRIGGEQQIVLGLNLHSHARKILYPPGYTTEAVPVDMDADDRLIMKRMAVHMASTNGYRAQQSGRWYLTSGTFGDWSYYRQRILPLTMELGPGGGAQDRYLTSAQIGPEVEGNREAILWWLEQSPCPAALIGQPCEAA